MPAFARLLHSRESMEVVLTTPIEEVSGPKTLRLIHSFLSLTTRKTKTKTLQVASRLHPSPQANSSPTDSAMGRAV